MKKITICILLLVTILMLSGCNLWAVEARLDALEEAVDHRIDAVEDAAEAAVMQAILPEHTPPAPEPAPVTPAKSEPSAPAAPALAATLTKEEAEAIALEYANFTADQVSYLRTEFEIDDRIPQYDVQFHEGFWEYEFEIHAETGAILSFDKDD